MTALLSPLQLVGDGLLPFTTDKQNLLLSTAIQIANQQSLPIVSLNVSSWQTAPSQVCSVTCTSTFTLAQKRAAAAFEANVRIPEAR